MNYVMILFLIPLRMRTVFDIIIDYKQIHPIRFLVLLIALFLVVLASIVGLRRLFIKLKSNKSKSQVNIEGNNSLKEDLKDAEKTNKVKRLFTVKHIYIEYKRVINIGVYAVISMIFLASIVYFMLNNKKENIWISNSKYIFGIDVSHYQGSINWSKVKTSKHPIKFVFMRSTMGSDGKDNRFSENWLQAKREGYICGAYHYYRPNENSVEQFVNFALNVKLEKGDFPPVLDIEQTSKFGTENLRRGILSWLKLTEAKYGVKPIIYTGRTFYNKYLEGYVDDYPLWIASYSAKHKLNNIDWEFHQFTEQVRIKGVNSWVDGNDFNGTMVDLKNMLIK